MQPRDAGWPSVDSSLTAVDVYVPRMRIDVAALIESRLEALKPEDAVRNGGLGLLSDCADHFAALKHRAGRQSVTKFFRDAMQAKRRFVRVLRLANAESRRGNNQTALLGVPPSGDLPELGHALIGDAGPKQRRRRLNAVPLACLPNRLKRAGTHSSGLSSTFDLRPLSSAAAWRASGKSSSVPSVKPALD